MADSVADDGVEIDASNFNEYFHDVRRSRPQPGQVMARFRAAALFGPGREKRDMIRLLQKDKATAAAMVMRKIHCAREPDCYRVCREMCEDLLAGMSEEAVENKDYEFILEAFFYAKPEHVPKDHPHWHTASVVEFDPETNTYHSRIELSAPKNPGPGVDTA